MKMKLWVPGYLILIILLSILPGEACEFYFNYQEVKAPLGVTGTIGIRVRKDHQDCTMEGMDYQLEWANIQVIEETPWEEIGTALYEKQLQVVLSQIGSGYLSISKDCSREGYQEKQLPITVVAGGENWEKAIGETYPYPREENIYSQKGPFEINETSIIIGDTIILLPEIPPALNSCEGPIVVYYIQSESNKALLIAGEEIFFPFSWER